MDILIVIVSFNSALDIRDCLDSLLRSHVRGFRVAICENAGYTAFERLRSEVQLDRYAGLKIDLHLAGSNLGYAGGINFLLSSSGPAQFYWILNPDTIPAEDALGALLERIAKNDCGIVSHDILLSNGLLASRGGIWNRLTARALSIDMLKARNAGISVDAVEKKTQYVIGASMFFSDDFLAATGPLREDYFLYCEEIEWCIRAKRNGQNIGYSASAVVTHKHGTSTGGGGRLRERSRLSVYLNERARMLLTRDLFPNVFPIASVLALISIFGRYIRNAAPRQLVYAIDGWRAGLKNERGLPDWAGPHHANRIERPKR